MPIIIYLAYDENRTKKNNREVPIEKSDNVNKSVN